MEYGYEPGIGGPEGDDEMWNSIWSVNRGHIADPKEATAQLSASSKHVAEKATLDVINEDATGEAEFSEEVRIEIFQIEHLSIGYFC